ncbi:MAG: NAD(P)-binding domain-containing protein [Bacteroidales bacterium]|nr:NAD(P)-binding domain-containing protein [Bacteroidales bacterium]
MEYKLGEEARCAVIGYGSWATAIVSLLVKNEKEVWWYVRNGEVLESLATEGYNPKYLNDVKFDTAQIRPSSDINEVVSNAKIIIMAAPSAFLKDFLEPLTVSLKDKFVVSAIKGIIPGDYKTVVEYLHDRYELTYKQIGIISGASHAEEVGNEMLSYLTVVCTDPDNAQLIGSKIATKYIRLSYSNDIYGVEYAAILKNIYALAVGIATSLAYGDNFRAVLISKCAKEMTSFLNGSYPADRDTLNPEYLGDLLVTCYSPYSRNRRLGLLVGKGISVKSALSEMTMIAEGYYAVDCIKHINFRHKVDMPIVDAVYDIFYRNASARRRMKELTNLL